MIYLLILLGIACFMGLFLPHVLIHLSGRWGCRFLDWHPEPREVGFDGCSQTGKCPRCGKSVLQARGQWFSTERQP